jgi:hypothetical protein
VKVLQVELRAKKEREESEARAKQEREDREARIRALEEEAAVKAVTKISVLKLADASNTIHFFSHTDSMSPTKPLELTSYAADYVDPGRLTRSRRWLPCVRSS